MFNLVVYMEKIQIILGDASKYGITTTTDLMAMVKTLAIDKKIPVGMFSTQSSNVQVVNQLVCTSVPEIKNERLSKQQWEKASDFLGILADAPLYLDDTPEPSMSSIKDKCHTCPLYPQCVRIKMCPEEHENCSMEQCENKIKLIKRALIKEYELSSCSKTH